MPRKNELQKRWERAVHSLENETLERIFPHTMAHSLEDNVLTIRFDTTSDQNQFFSATNQLLRKVREEFGEKVSLSAITKRRGGDRQEEEGLTRYETNTMTFMEGAFTSTQNKIIQRIIYESELEMRERIGGEPVQLELFKEENEQKMKVIRLKMSEIGRSNNYDNIREAVEKLRAMPIRIPIKTEKYSGEYVTSIIHSYFIPDSSSYRKEIILTIDSDILRIMQTPRISEAPDLKGVAEGERVTGYTLQIAKGYNRLGNYDLVLSTTNNRFTQRIYKFLTAFRDKESFALSIKDLRRILGIEKNYKRWVDFKKAVLTDPWREMMENREKWEFRFEYEEIREKRGKKTGMPDGIRFYVKNNEKEEEEFKRQREETAAEQTLREALDLMETEMTEGKWAMTGEQWKDIRERIKDSGMYMRVNTAYRMAESRILAGRVANPPAYMYRALIKETERDIEGERKRLEEEARKLEADGKL